MLNFLNKATRISLSVVFISIFITIAMVVFLERKLPKVEVLRDVQLQVPLRIYSQDHKLIAEYGEKRRIPINLEQVPQDLVNAIIATEDRRFYKHPGVDMKGIMRAVHALITKGMKAQGGSTITMQVARNFFLTRKKTYVRKINEILLALKIEQELTKQEILELYLNKIYLGKRAYGIAAAADVYYGKEVQDLTLAQMAMLAGLPQAPSLINPLNSSKLASKRRAHVLTRMLNYGFIEQEQYATAMAEPLTASYHGRNIELEAPFVAEMVRKNLIDQYGEKIYETGSEVITTIDSKMQKAANAALRRALLEYDQRHGYRQPEIKLAFDPDNCAAQELESWQQQLKQYSVINGLQPAAVTALSEKTIWALMQGGELIEIPWNNFKWALGKEPYQTSINNVLQIGNIIYLTKVKNGWHLTQVPEVEGAFVALAPDNGAIYALVGGFDYAQSRFNRATQAERQPGSSFKPFIYGAALEHGFTTASIINDAPIVEENIISEYDWRPRNYTRKFYGPTRLRVGITHSRNLVSIRLLKALGIEKATDFMTRCGLEESSLPKGLSLALGTNHLTPLDLTAAYSVFPNGGYRVEPYFIEKINDYHGNAVFQAEFVTAGEDAPRAISSQMAYLMTSLLQDAIVSGTGKRALQLGRKDLAGKTGTTNDWVDGWYSGYNRDLVATSWVGYDKPRSLKEYAVKAALPMWIYFMDKALRGKPENSPVQPPGLTTARIDPKTGLLARSGQADAIYELFLEGSVPEATAPISSEQDYVEDLF